MMSAKRGKLLGVKVLELGHFVAAPNLGSLLSFFDAEVVKVEPVRGDVTRDVAPWSFYAFGFNKKSICLDLAQGKGREVFYRLVKVSDVVIENLSPEAITKLGIGYPKLSELNPRIIYCSIKGFAGDSPQADRLAFDTVAQAEGGLIATLGGEDDEPVRINNPCVDLGASGYALASIALALMERERSGVGQYIEVPLVDVALYWSGYWISYYSLTGKEPVRLGSGHAGYSPYGIYRAKDGHLFIGVITDEQWVRLCRALGIEGGDRMAKMSDRLRQRKVVDEIVRRKVMRMTISELLLKLEREVPIASIRGIRELSEDEELKRRGMIMESEIEDKKFKSVMPPMKMSGHSYSLRSLPAEKGRDTWEILSSLGYTKEDVIRLMKEGVVSGPTAF